MQSTRARNREKLQHLLRELFQFDAAGLDFGIYRILNYKRDEIERFIERDLLDAVEEGLAGFQAAERDDLEAKLAEKKQQLGDAAFDETGAVREQFHGLPIAQEYEKFRRQLRQLDIAEETEARIFNDLYRFFARYYDNGDFLTERRYSSQEPKFAVPYNGEEVLLHWANRDQYYVKTSERFTDYRFKVGDYTIWFQLDIAEVPANNVKGDTRYFVLRDTDPLEYDAEEQVLTIHFEYRPLTEEEEERYLGIYNKQQPKSSRRKTLDRSVLVEALEAEIMAQLEVAEVKYALARPHGAAETARRTELGYHLNRYTARNTMDYFVHKDLGGFLRRELDFFLKNEVLNVGDFLGDPSGEALQYVMSRARVVRLIGEKIIAFLAQIEDFQKRLFEKRKFVVQTDYCVTLDRVPEGFYPEILANEAQLAEWRRLYKMDAWDQDLFYNGDFDAAFLKNHPYLMLDTAFFDDDFKARLLATFDDPSTEPAPRDSRGSGQGLDAAIDGVLIHGENFQALNLLQAKYGGQVKCIYIDPPYNTGNDEFIYKDNYQHSSWLAMMADRLRVARELLTGDGAILISIDDGEEHTLRMLCNDIFGTRNFLANLVWKSRQNVDSRATTNISNDHEFVLAYGHAFRGGKKDESKYSNPDNDPRGPWMSDNMVGLRSKQDRPNLHYDILVGETEHLPPDGQKRHDGLWQVGQHQVLVKKDTLTNQECGPIEVGSYVFVLGEEKDDKFVAYFVGNMTPLSEGMPRPSNVFPCTKKGWRYEPSRMASLILDQRILWPSDPTGRPRKKTFLNELKSAYTGFSSVVGYTRDGTTTLVDLFGEEMITFPKPPSLVSTLVEQISDVDSSVIDFFAGSGTTAQSVMDLNREDGGDRKYILVEMGEYFDTVLKPRIQKVAFSANWKAGVPQDRDGMSHMFKYQRLESYEDALNNIRVRSPAEPQLSLLYDELDDYMLSYMLDFETRDSPTLLTQEAFETPFDYKLNIQRGHESPQPTWVDLVETFHYLLGMHVRRLERHAHQDRKYVVSRGEVRTEHGIESVVVIWRNRAGLDLEQEADWVNSELLPEPADRVYVNGESFIQNAEPLEFTFRDRMEASPDGA